MNQSPNQSQRLIFYHWNSKPSQQILQYLDTKKEYVEYQIVDEIFVVYKLDYTKSILLSDLCIFLDYSYYNQYKNQTLNEVQIQLKYLYEEIKEMINLKIEDLNYYYILVIADETNKLGLNLIFLGQTQTYFVQNSISTQESKVNETSSYDVLEYIFDKAKTVAMPQNNNNFYLKQDFIHNLELRDTYLNALNIDNQQIQLSKKQLTELKEYNFNNEYLEKMVFIHNLSLRHQNCRRQIMVNVKVFNHYMKKKNIKNSNFILLVCSSVNFEIYKQSNEYEAVFNQIKLKYLDQFKKQSENVAFQFIKELIYDEIMKTDFKENQYTKIFMDVNNQNIELVKQCDEELKSQFGKIKIEDFCKPILAKYCRMALTLEQVQNKWKIGQNIQRILNNLNTWDQKQFTLEYQFIKEYAYEKQCQYFVQKKSKIEEYECENQLTQLKSELKYELQELSRLEQLFGKECLFNNEYLIKQSIQPLRQRINANFIKDLFKDGQISTEKFNQLGQEVIQNTLIQDITKFKEQVNQIKKQYDQQTFFQLPKVSYQFYFYREITHQIITIKWNPKKTQLSPYVPCSQQSFEQNQQKLIQIKEQHKEFIEKENIREIIVNIMITSLLIQQNDNESNKSLQELFQIYKEFKNKLNYLQPPTYQFIEDLLFQQILYQQSWSSLEEQFVTNELNQYSVIFEEELMLLLNLQDQLYSEIVIQFESEDQSKINLKHKLEKHFYELVDENKFLEIFKSEAENKIFLEQIKVQIQEYIRIQKEEEEIKQLEKQQLEKEVQSKQIQQQVILQFDEYEQLVDNLKQFLVILDQSKEYTIKEMEEMLKNAIKPFFIKVISEFFDILVGNLSQQCSNNQNENIQKQIKKIKLNSNPNVNQLINSQIDRLKFKSQQELKIILYIELWSQQIQQSICDLYVKDKQQDLIIDPKIYFDEQEFEILQSFIKNSQNNELNQNQQVNNMQQCLLKTETQNNQDKPSNLKIPIKRIQPQTTVNPKISCEALFESVKQFQQKLCNQYDLILNTYLIEYQKEESDNEINKLLIGLSDKFEQFYQNNDQKIKQGEGIEIKKYILQEFWLKQYLLRIIEVYEQYLERYERDYQNVEEELI